MRLLIVEDSVDAAELLSELLGVRGYDVEVAHTVTGALIKIDTATKPFDLILSDLGLPDASGYELIKQAQSRGPIKAIAMSGFSEDAVRGREAGFSAHLVKPVRIQALEQAITSAMR